MHILVAPNAFKNSLAAGDAAEAISEGLQQSRLVCSTECFPVGDGGDGTGDLLIQRCNGHHVAAEVHDPLGRQLSAHFGVIDNLKAAVIEMANASGLRLMRQDELNPLRATSFGTGELIRQALSRNVETIILCIGGSATVDGGTGILKALGFRFLDSNYDELSNMPESLVELHSIDDSNLDERITKCRVVVLCDVKNPLLGPDGAARVFGPQKGATASDIVTLEAALSQFSKVVFSQTNRDIGQTIGGGAAGGTAAGLAGLLGAELVNGIDYFLEISKFDEALQRADLVITGEGCIDIQTLSGKGPYGVATQARKKGLAVVAFAGVISPGMVMTAREWFDALLEINQGSPDLPTAIRETRQNLIKASKDFGDAWAERQKPGKDFFRY